MNAFEVDIGHGWFMDSSGKLHKGLDTLAPLYPQT